MVNRCVYSSVSTHTLIPSPYLLVYPLCGASRVTRMLQLRQEQRTRPLAEPCPRSHNRGFLTLSFSIHTMVRPHDGFFLLFVAVLFPSGPLARPCLHLSQASEQASLHLTSKSSLVTASFRDKHIKSIKHMQALINDLRHEGGRCGHRTRVLTCALVFSDHLP